MNGNFIAGEWTVEADGGRFERRNPADVEELVGVFPDSGAGDVTRAVEALVTGHREWAATPPDRRAQVIASAADLLEQRQSDLARELVREEGKTLAEASFETSRTPANLRMFASEALRLTGQTFPTGDGSLVYTERTPLGVVAAITPWNFPLNIPSRKLAPALAAGNGVLYKPSELTPLLGQRLVEALLDAGLPRGSIALVHGGARAGAAITADDRVSAVTFTGSYAVGSQIHSAMGTTRRCQLEMGGKNALVVLEDSNLERAAQLVIKGAFGLSGQACTGTSRVIAHAAVHDELVSRVAKHVLDLRIGNGLEEGVTMGPLASQAQMEKFVHYVDVARQEGARLVAGGERLTERGLNRGWFVRPAVFEGLRADMRLACEEVFGPVVGFHRISGLDEAVELANATEYGLAAAIVTDNVATALQFARSVDAGVVKVNQPTTGMAMNAPFGGLKHSSTQTYKEQGGELMMHFYTSEKTVYITP